MKVEGSKRKVEGSPETRERIIEGAMKVFSRQGFFRAPVRLIAMESGVSKGLIFWYFSSKDELILEVAKRSLPLDVIKECLRTELRGKDLLKCIGKRYLDKYREEGMRRLLIYATAIGPSYPRVDNYIRELCEDLMGEAAERAFGDRSLRSLIKIRQFFGTLLCYILRPPRWISDEEYLNEVVNLIWIGQHNNEAHRDV